MEFDGRVDAGDRRPEARKRFGDEPATAPDVENGEVAQRLQFLRRALEVAHERLADEAEPGGALV